MKIGRETVPRTAICTSDEHTIVVRGRDLSKELIGKISFVEHFFLLLNGRMPSAETIMWMWPGRLMLRAVARSISPTVPSSGTG